MHTEKADFKSFRVGLDDPATLRSTRLAPVPLTIEKPFGLSTERQVRNQADSPAFMHSTPSPSIVSACPLPTIAAA